ncbi:MAG: hypothetical protein SFW66_10230 [Gammaproteobacteria bacterium]|nr:hypothetical protein [Gammaproteobacteria bacterium]
MKRSSFFLLFLFSVQILLSTVSAQTNLHQFMTPRDMMNQDSVSGIQLKNNRSSAATVYGLYVNQYAYVTPGDTCDHSTIIYSTTQNTTAGAFVMPTVLNAGKSAAVGSNFLYNMIYSAIYYVNIIIPSSPPGCALPGCTWGSDSAIYNWCIYLGALAPVATSAGYTANVPPATDAASSGSYNYNVVSSYSYLGPISCNDQTLTCTVSTSQTQSFS